MESRGGHNRYPDCKHIPRSLPKDITMEQALALPRSKGEDIFPLFEKKIKDHKRLKLCSLETNELLQCRWRNYVARFDGLKRYPFNFPTLDDFHYHGYEVKYMPSLSPKNQTPCRMQMGIGPGVDSYGQLPVPNDMHVRKYTTIKPVESSKTNQH